jgi:collagenase-like PrtC family protease
MWWDVQTVGSCLVVSDARCLRSHTFLLTSAGNSARCTSCRSRLSSSHHKIRQTRDGEVKAFKKALIQCKEDNVEQSEAKELQGLEARKYK